MNPHTDLAKQRERASTWGRVVKARLRAVLEHCGDMVLDVGCSTGDYLRALEAHNRQAIGCDLLRDLAWTNEQVLLQADALKLPFAPESFDGAYAFEVLEHLHHPEQALQELHRVVRNNIVVSVPLCSEPEIFKLAGLSYYHWTDRTHVQFFSQEEICGAVENSGFQVIRTASINPTVPEKILFSALGIPTKAAHLLGEITKRFPLRRRYCMTTMVVAAKNG